MSRTRRLRALVLLLLLLPQWLAAPAADAGDKVGKKADKADALASWQEGPAKKSIVDFVRQTTDKASPKYVPPAERIATFDMDGTLWVEQPMYTQVVFAIDRLRTLAAKNPEWRMKEPFKGILDDTGAAPGHFNMRDYLQVLYATHAGMTVDDFDKIAKDWLTSARHPRYKRPYTECIYQPMLEVIVYLRAHGFKTYIVTGSGQAFVRAFAEPVFGIPPERVIGSALRLKYKYRGIHPVLERLASMLLDDNEEGKPEDIELFIGRKPLAAFGNSDGDRQMLEWTGSGAGPRLMMLVHHDDGEREYAYGAKSKVGTFSDSLMTEAHKRGWSVISMKNDWNRIFSFEK